MEIRNKHLYDFERMLGLLQTAEDAWQLTMPKCTCEGKYDDLCLANGDPKKIAGRTRHFNSKRHAEYERKWSEWMGKQPSLKIIAGLGHGSLFVDICAGSAPVKLLFRQEFSKKFPLQPIRELLASQQRRHKHLGYDSVTINVYNNKDLGGLLSMEVKLELWQDADMEDLEEAAELVRTGRWLLKTTT